MHGSWRGLAFKYRQEDSNRNNCTYNTQFWNGLGKAYSKICGYMRLRVGVVEKGHHVLIDGTLKTG